MKKIFLITAALTLLASCNYLDVKPGVESPAKELFEKQEGFESALTGAYMRMRSEIIYGRRLTIEDPEYYAQHWGTNGYPNTPLLLDYKYSNAAIMQRNDEIFETLYKVIADVNSILEVIDDRKGVFESGYYELIKGEALALRAFCHLDLLRLFGPVPTAANIAAGDPVLPYVTTISKTPQSYLSFGAYTAALEADLDMAEQLLGTEGVEPLREYTMTELSPKGETQSAAIVTQVSDSWLYYRQTRMNYFAVLGTKARYYMWVGDKDNAGKYADMVIEATTEGTMEKVFRLGQDTDFNAREFSLPSEHIFAIHDEKLEELTKWTFINATQSSHAITAIDAPALYPDGATDQRRKLWMPHSDLPGRYYILKYEQYEEATGGNSNKIYTNQLPLIRLAEMYLISVEAKGYAAGTDQYNIFNRARGANDKTFADQTTFNAELLREYNREFIAEGQGFYAYKRMNSPTIAGFVNSDNRPMEQIYVIPRPDRELNFN